MTDSRDEHEPYAIPPAVEDADIVPWLRLEADAAAHQPSPWRMLAAAADAIERLTAERDEARREVCEWVEMDGATTANEEAELRGWNCYKNAPVVKTLKGVVVSKGKAVPPKFDLEEDGK
jgi:hypothetical protein